MTEREKKVRSELFENQHLTEAQKSAIKKRLEVEHKQELACMGYLSSAAAGNQKWLYAREDSINPLHPRHVITDVLQHLPAEKKAELRLDPNIEEVAGMPWEVKDCDGMNPMEHAHGQSDFQRIFANCKKGSLWLFTTDAVSASHNGRQNFEVFCTQVLPRCKDRYNEVILARRLAPYDCEDVSKEAADATIIASWNSSTGQIEWKEEAPDSLMLAPLNLYGELSELFEFS